MKDDKKQHQAFLVDIEELEKTKQIMKGKTMFLELGSAIDQHQDEHAVAEGEYLMRITSADVKPEKGFILVRMEVVDDPYAKEVSTFLNLPGSGRTPKDENRILGRLKYFFSCFDLDPHKQYNPSEQEPEGFVGAEGYVMLSAPEDKDDGYGPQNKVKRFSPRR
jgi:hypothetical protein